MRTFEPFVHSTNLIQQPDKLRTQMKKDGYLFLPGLLKPETVHQVREAIIGVCQEQGWADAEGNPQGEPIVEGGEGFWDVYDPLQKLEVFHGLALEAEILHVIELLVQDKPLAHPRNISRIVFPQTDFFTTPPHQDYVHIQGTPETYTAWFPLSDCPQHMGSLVVLAGSHAELKPVYHAGGAGGLSVETSDDDSNWHGSDFEAGDVLIFHSHTIHKALPNHTDQFRISVDYRYQGASQPVVADSLFPHYNRLTWEEIYADWTRPELKYYWEAMDLNTVSRSNAFRENALKQM